MTNMTTAPTQEPITIQPKFPLFPLWRVVGVPVGGDVVTLNRTSASRIVPPIEAPSSDLCCEMIVSNVLLGKTETFVKDIPWGCCT